MLRLWLTLDFAYIYVLAGEFPFLLLLMGVLILKDKYSLLYRAHA